MTDINISDARLTVDPGFAGKPDESMIAYVASEYGVHPLTQMRDILSRRFGRQKLGANEYYDFRVFDPSHSRKEKNEFLGQGAINTLNYKINPDSLMETKNFLGNKLIYTARLKEVGIPTTETQAFVARGYGQSSDLLIEDEAGLLSFLRERAVYPLFGKPQGGSKAVGTACFDRLEEDVLVLGNGGRVGIDQLVEEVFSRYSDGYLFQSALRPHKQMAEATGKALCCVRMVTYREGGSVLPLYSVWRIPGPEAMSDNFWQTGSMMGLIDDETGEVKTFIRGKGPKSECLTHHPKSGKPILGFKIPHWEALCKVAFATHEVTPDLPILGLDIAITDKGPVVLESNDLPNHVNFQYAARRGVYNTEFRPIFKRLAKQVRR